MGTDTFDGRGVQPFLATDDGPPSSAGRRLGQGEIAGFRRAFDAQETSVP